MLRGDAGEQERASSAPSDRLPFLLSGRRVFAIVLDSARLALRALRQHSRVRVTRRAKALLRRHPDFLRGGAASLFPESARSTSFVPAAMRARSARALLSFAARSG